jgi:hypothetical protein
MALPNWQSSTTPVVFRIFLDGSSASMVWARRPIILAWRGATVKRQWRFQPCQQKSGFSFSRADFAPRSGGFASLFRRIPSDAF